MGLPARVVTLPLVVGAILLLIIVGVNWAPMSAVLSWRPIVFLGTISFSLYLVHRPVMIASAFLFGVGRVPAVIEIVAGIAIAVGFAYAIEKPVHHLSRKIAASLRHSERSAPTPASEIGNQRLGVVPPDPR